jgi:hypothetical protein
VVDPEWLTVARRVARKWRTHTLGEELEATAMWAAWKHRDLPAPHIGAICRTAMIDELRRCTGRSATGARRQGLGVTQPTERIDQLATCDDAESVSTLYGLTGRMAFIADSLASGDRRVDIARHLGVDPSRVTQLIRELRRLIDNERETT